MLIRSLLSLCLAMSLNGWSLAQSVDSLHDSVTRHIEISSPRLALEHVTIIDGSGSPPLVDQTILIQDGRILSVVPTVASHIPDGFTRYDLRDHTVIPGIVGLHNHLHHPGVPVSHHAAPHLYLAGGVTTLFSAGSAAPIAELNMAEAVRRGLGPGPDMHIAAPYVTGTAGNWVMSQPQTVEQAQDFVDYWVAEGVAGFKLYRHVSLEIARAVIDRAHAHGMPVTGHLCSLTFQEAAQLGIDRIEHGYISMSDLVPDKAESECPATFQSLVSANLDDASEQQVIETLVSEGVTLTSTLAIIESHFAHRQQGDARSLATLSPDSLAEYETRQSTLAERQASSRFTPEFFAKVLEFERRFVAAGGHLVAGPDNGRHVVPGYGDQRNFELLVEAGFSVPAAVQIMTHNGAVELGLGTDRGLVRPGYRADILVIEGSLAQSPHQIRQMRYVFRNGLGYDPISLAEQARAQVGLR